MKHETKISGMSNRTNIKFYYYNLTFLFLNKYASWSNRNLLCICTHNIIMQRNENVNFLFDWDCVVLRFFSSHFYCSSVLCFCIHIQEEK